MTPRQRTANPNANSALSDKLSEILIKTKQQLKQTERASKPGQVRARTPVKALNCIITEAKYAVEIGRRYNRPFESRLPTLEEQSEIHKETLKLNDGFYVNRNIFFLSKTE